MKREHLFLEQLSDTQLGHTSKIVQREIARRASERPQPKVGRKSAANKGTRETTRAAKH